MTFFRDDASRERPPIPGADFAQLRAEMIEKQLRRRGISDEGVLAAMEKVSREEFVPEAFRARAYDDGPLPIGEGQTISQPYIVATMAAAVGLTGSGRVLEVGAGCGYQAAVLALLASEVFAVESISRLASEAAARLERLGCTNVHIHCGDGTLGLPEFAPFDGILVSAAAPGIPEPLRWQLAESGRLIIPVGDAENQELQLVQRHGNSFETHTLEACRFVPLVGHHGWKEPPPR